jgi:hypothetical protein
MNHNDLSRWETLGGNLNRPPIPKPTKPTKSKEKHMNSEKWYDNAVSELETEYDNGELSPEEFKFAMKYLNDEYEEANYK